MPSEGGSVGLQWGFPLIHLHVHWRRISPFQPSNSVVKSQNVGVPYALYNKSPLAKCAEECITFTAALTSSTSPMLTFNNKARALQPPPHPLPLSLPLSLPALPPHSYPCPWTNSIEMLS